MSKGKIFNKSYRNVLYLAISCFVIVALLIALSSTSLAKFISSHNSDQSAGTAKMGIETFELIEHGKHGEKDDTTVKGTQLKYDCKKIIPGVDIPGPHVKLKIESEVSCALYVKVNVPNVTCIKFGDGKPTATQTVTYKMADGWEAEGASETVTVGGVEYTVYTYKYANVFNPATKYNHTEETGALGEISVLDGDAIKVSQYYKSSSEDGVSQKFSLTFNAYVRQVLTTPYDKPDKS